MSRRFATSALGFSLFLVSLLQLFRPTMAQNEVFPGLTITVGGITTATVPAISVSIPSIPATFTTLPRGPTGQIGTTGEIGPSGPSGAGILNRPSETTQQGGTTSYSVMHTYEPHHSGLNNAAVAGIAAGALGFSMILGISIYLYCRRRRRRRMPPVPNLGGAASPPVAVPPIYYAPTPELSRDSKDVKGKPKRYQLIDPGTPSIPPESRHVVEMEGSSRWVEYRRGTGVELPASSLEHHGTPTPPPETAYKPGGMYTETMLWRPTGSDKSVR